MAANFGEGVGMATERQQLRWGPILLVLGLVIGGATIYGLSQHPKDGSADTPGALVGDGAQSLDDAGRQACDDFNNWYGDYVTGVLTNEDARVKIGRIRERDGDTSNTELYNALTTLQADLTSGSTATLDDVGVVRGICT